ncbi:CHAD domain-containing protein [Vibrio sp.]|uniref:CHAD domain-containing protein n=1 Tax=Vibrio sp. TaxID=678 RepID=UPI003D133817
MDGSSQKKPRKKARISSRTPVPQKKKIVVAPDLPVHLSMCEFYQTCLAAARELEPGILDDRNSEYLHQYRVYLRKMRAIASTLKELKTDVTRHRFIPALKDLMKHTNQLRDLDVYLLKSNFFYSELDKKYHPGLTQFFDDINFLRIHEYNRVVKWFSSERYQKKCHNVEQQILSILNTLHDKNGPENSKKYGNMVIARSYEKVVNQATLINKKSKDKEIHRLRINCKNLRYLLEFFTPVLDKTVYQHQVKALKSLQHILGEFNDSSVQTKFLTNYLKHIEDHSPAYRAVSQLKQLTENRQFLERKQLLEQLSSKL